MYQVKCRSPIEEDQIKGWFAAEQIAGFTKDLLKPVATNERMNSLSGRGYQLVQI